MFPSFSNSVAAEEEVVTVDVSQAKTLLLQSEHRFLDVRTQEEFRRGHCLAPKILNVPYMLNTPQGRVKNEDFLDQVSSLLNPTDDILVGCQSGARSLSATTELVTAVIERNEFLWNSPKNLYRAWNLVPFSETMISSIDFHKSSSYMVTASDDDSIRLYDVGSATCMKTINSKKYGVDLVCFTCHPTTVIYSSRNGWDDSLRLLSLHDNKYLRYFKGHHDRVVSLSLSSAGDCFISGSLDRTVLLWDQRVDKCQGLLRVQGRPAAAYDDQGLVFAVAFGGYIRLFDARMYDKGPFEIFSVGGDVSEANVVKFSSDGRLMLLTTMDGHIHVLDSFRGTLISTYSVKPVAGESTLDATFSPEGMFVVSGSGDGSTHAWGVRSGKQVHSWMGNGSEPPVIKWAPGSPMFVTGSLELAFVIPDLSKLPAYAIRK